MDKIAILDDDEQWSLAVKRYFRNHYEVTTFKRRFNFLQAVGQFDLVIIDFSIPPANFETDIDGCGIIAHLKQTLKNPPILVMASGFISKNSPELGYESVLKPMIFLRKMKDWRPSSSEPSSYWQIEL